MSLNALQGATLVVAHATFTKVLLSFTLCTYQYFEWDSKRRAKVQSNFNIEQFQKAQINESEYAALIAAPLFYLALRGVDATTAATVSAVGQMGYVWVRTVWGYPTLPTITVAVIRYGGLVWIAAELWKLAF